MDPLTPVRHSTDWHWRRRRQLGPDHRRHPRCLVAASVQRHDHRLSGLTADQSRARRRCRRAPEHPGHSRSAAEHRCPRGPGTMLTDRDCRIRVTVSIGSGHESSAYARGHRAHLPDPDRGSACGRGAAPGVSQAATTDPAASTASRPNRRGGETRIRLLDVPTSEANDPGAFTYIIDRLAGDGHTPPIPGHRTQATSRCMRRSTQPRPTIGRHGGFQFATAVRRTR